MKRLALALGLVAFTALPVLSGGYPPIPAPHPVVVPHVVSPVVPPVMPPVVVAPVVPPIVVPPPVVVPPVVAVVPPSILPVVPPPVPAPIPVAVPQPTPPPQPKPGPSGGGALCTGGCVWVAGYIMLVTSAIIVHEVLGPACASNTKAKRKWGYDKPTFWRPYCKHHRKVVRVRG